MFVLTLNMLKLTILFTAVNYLQVFRDGRTGVLFSVGIQEAVNVIVT